MAIRSRTSDGYQQVELTSELLHRQSGSTQQVISTVPCRRHLPFFITIVLADLFLFGSIILFAVYSTYYGDGFSIEAQVEAPFKHFNLHGLIMLVALLYLNGQAITAYKSNYMVKHKSVTMLYQFVLQLLAFFGIACGIYYTFNAQTALQSSRLSPSHFYSIHSWVGLITIALFFVHFMCEFFSLFIAICCRKLTARMKAKAQPFHKMLIIIVVSLTVTTIISGLNQLARFELDGQKGRESYRDFLWSTILINLTALSVICSMIFIFAIIFLFKRRQAHDLPVLFKLILVVLQFIEIILIIVVVEYIFQVITPHLNKVMSGELLKNSTISHIYNNATRSVSEFIESSCNKLSICTANNSSVATSNDTITTTLAPTT